MGTFYCKFMKPVSSVCLTLLAFAIIACGPTPPKHEIMPSQKDSGASSGFPLCTANGGQGYGATWEDSNGVTMAKDDSNMDDSSICAVNGDGDFDGGDDTSKGKYPKCTANGGLGYGSPWEDSDKATLSKNDPEMDDSSICVVAANGGSGDADDNKTPAGSKYPKCTGNGGNGYYAPWEDEATGERLSKNEPSMDAASICVVSNSGASNTTGTGGVTSGTGGTTTTSEYPQCTANGGMGYGNTWQDNNFTMAKNDPSFADTSICVVKNSGATTGATTSTDKYPQCTANGGKGYGSTWTGEGDLTYAKDDPSLDDSWICIVH